MQEYLGISFVVVVITLCAAILVRLATKAILDEIDKSRAKRAKALVTALTPILNKMTETIDMATTNGRAKTYEEVKTPRKRTTVKKTEEKAE